MYVYHINKSVHAQTTFIIMLSYKTFLKQWLMADLVHLLGTVMHVQHSDVFTL